MSTRIGTFNLLHGIPILGAGSDAGRALPPAPAVDMLHTAAVELDADVLGLQEVDRHQPRSGFADQTAAVADALGAQHWRFAPALHGTPGHTRAAWSTATADDGANTDGPTYGVGLVSRLPVLGWHVRRFKPAPFSIPLLVPGQPRPRLTLIPDEPRVVLAAVIQGPSGPFTVVTAHLSFVPGYNVRQLRALVRWAATLPQPVFIGGDFNLPGSLPQWITGWDSLASGATYPSFKPKVQFDHVLAHGLPRETAHSSTIHALAVSDHCALTIDVDLGLGLGLDLG